MASFPKFTPSWHTTTYAALSPSNASVSAANKTVLITGGGRGIGSSIAASFATAGASHIILLGRSESHLVSVKKNLESTNPKSKIHIFAADVVDSKTIDETFAKIHETIGPIDILVSNAGYAPELTSISESSLTDWWRGFEVNVLGAFIVTRAFLKTAATNPTLINISTAITHLPAIEGLSSYSSSKEAFLRVMDFVSIENPSLKIMNVHPGVIETDMYVKSGGKMHTDDSKPASFRNAMNQMLTCFRVQVSLPGDFAVWAASPEADFLKGRLVWVNWDIEELKAQKNEILEKDLLTMGLRGWPAA
ncbi:MAG: hypothetical protein M1830_002040 [Pleopsidium flavum]|nr:MAG: hypothetical protein M1830_002040 [Pleopsidium flavum]